jgi:signal transduction histidine kinase
MAPRDSLGNPRAAARKRWAARLFGLAMFGLLSIMFLFQLRQDRIASLSAATATAERLAQVLEEHTRETAASVNAVLSATALHLRTLDGAGTANRDSIRNVLIANARSLPYLKALSFIGADGRMVASSLMTLTEGFDASERDYFRTHATGEKRMLIGVAVPSLFSGAPIVPMTIPVESGVDGSFAGVIVAVMESMRSESFYKALQVGEQGIVAIASGGTVMVLQTPGREIPKNSAIPAQALFGDMRLDAPSGAFRIEMPLDGVDRIMGYRKPDDLSVVVLVGISTDEALSRWHHDARGYFVAWAAAAAGVVALTLLLLKQMRRRDRAVLALEDTTQRLWRNERHLIRAQAVAHVGSWELDPRSSRIVWSEMMYEIFAQQRSFHLTLESITGLISRETRSLLQPLLDAALSGTVPAGIEIDIVRPDGQIRRCRCKCEPMMFGSQVAAVVGTLQDVTEMRRAEAKRFELERQLQQSLKMEALGTLAGGIAHDLNNALVPVLGLTECVLENLPAGSRDRADLEVVVGGAARARDLVRQILAFSRKEAPTRHAVDLGRVVSSTWDLLRRVMPPGIRVECSATLGAIVMADPSQLQQVVVNLVTNAAQAIGDRPGAIVISVARMGGEALLSVADTGNGMDEATRTRIFEPFFTTKPVGEGTGLGLSVVHGIVTGHGGRIDVRSNSDAGTVFEVALPLADVTLFAPDSEASAPCDFI